MQKIPASQIIEADDDFVNDLYNKLKAKQASENSELIEFNTKQAAKYCNKSTQTIRNHIKNYIRGITGAMVLKAKTSEKNSNYIILMKDLEQYKKNPHKTL